MIKKLFKPETVTFQFIEYLREPIIILKRDGYVAEANKAFLELFKTKKEDLIGKNSKDVMPAAMLSESITRCIFDKVERSEQIIFSEHILNVTVTPVVENGELNLINVVFRDISAFIQLERELVKRNKELGIINTLSGAFISSADINSVFMDLLEKVLIISDLSMGWIVIREDNVYALKSASGASLALKNALEKGRFVSLYENAARTGDPLYILESGEIESIEFLKKEGIVFLVCIPLRVGMDIRGFLMLASRVEVKFDFDLAALFSLIGNNSSLIIEKVRLFQETQRLSITDGLTGLYNARYFYEMLNKEIARALRYNAIFSLMLFDIDDFKILNDTYGHQAGDDVLRSLAFILKAGSRQTDIVTRYGGEEFIIILPNTPKHEAFNLASRIREEVEKHSYLEKESAKITISGGIATFPEDAEDLKSLLYAADMALYKAKAMGKKQVYPYGRIHGTNI